MSANTASNESFIRNQIDQTRSQVKFVDLVGGCMVLVIAVIAWLLIVAVVDAWLFDIGIAGRLLSFLVLMGGSVAWIAWRIWPALIGSVNPLYAAKTIEDTEPSFKNSLINLLTFRKNRAGVTPTVYAAMENQAASRLTEHPADGAVDKSALFYIGYVLAGLFVIAVAYGLLSPKNPLPSFARIVAPFAQIARPTRVRISEVQPRDAEVIIGDTLTVSAIVKGLRADESVRLVYSTNDGQSLDRVVDMKLDENGLRYTGEISPTANGVQQDFVYRIEAGDARTAEYQVDARQAPAMFVERLELTYPTYTGLGSRTIEGAGDIDAIEGTHVIVTARSNLPMSTAYIEFDVDEPADGQPVRRAEIVPMTIDGLTARGKIVLELRADRKTPMHSGYRVRFATEDGETNDDAPMQRIEVRPDLSPEIAVLEPTADPAEVAQNGELAIQVRALDPDYAVTNISLKAKSGEAALFDKALLEAQPGETGQIVKTFVFRPSDFGLVQGDEVVYRASVADNRVSSTDWLPEPNVARTRYRTIRVVASTDDDRRPEQSNSTQQEGDTQSNPENTTSEENKTENQAGDNRSEKPENNTGEGAKPEESGDTDEGKTQAGNEGETGENSNQTENTQNQTSESETQGNSGEGNTGEAGDESTETQQQTGNETGSGNSAASNQQTGEGESGSTPQEGATTSSEGSKPSSGDPSGETGEQPADSNEKLHDGEVIEKVNDLIKAMEKLSDEELEKAAGQQNADDPGNEKPESKPGEDDPELTPEQQERLKELARRIKEHREKQKQENQNNGGGSGASSAQERPDPSGGANSTNNVGANSKPSTDKPETDGSPPTEGERGSNDATTDSEGQDPGAGNTTENENGGSGGETPGAANEGASTEETTGAEPGEETPANTANETPSETGPKEDSQGGVEPEEGNPSEKPAQGNQGAATSEPGESAGTENQNDIPPSGGNETPKPGEAKEVRETGKPQSSSNEKTDQMEGDGEGFAGGEEAGGEQSSGKPGESGSGAASPSDTGSGAANEKGDGPTGNRAGEGAEANKPTGNSGEREGEGSTTEPGGEKAGASEEAGEADTPGEGTNHKPGGEGEGETNTGERIGDKPGGSPTSEPGGGVSGNPNRSQGAPNTTGELNKADKANLDYFRKATDLALDFLETEAEKPSEDLLEELNMTPEELKQFVDRWNAMKQAANEGSGASKRDFDESLRNLGLQTPGDKRSSAGAENDTVKNYRDAGSRSKAPADYLEQFRAFKQGASR